MDVALAALPELSKPSKALLAKASTATDALASSCFRIYVTEHWFSGSCSVVALVLVCRVHGKPVAEVRSPGDRLWGLCIPHVRI